MLSLSACHAHKAVGIINYSLTNKFSINATLIYSGKRYAYTAPDLNGLPVATVLDPYLLANTFYQLSKVAGLYWVRVCMISSIKSQPFHRPITGNYAPIPGRSSEFVVKVSYQLNFKK